MRSGIELRRDYDAVRLWGLAKATRDADGTLDDVARKAIARVREQGHADRLRRRAGHGKVAERDNPSILVTVGESLPSSA